MENKIEEMIHAIEKWLLLHDYNYIECNHVPNQLFVNNHFINMLWRTIFRLCPFNMRNMCKESSNGLFPITPQSNVALLKAFAISNEVDIIKKILNRVFSLRSNKTKNFALKQGIKISVNLYENSADDPTPLNTVWFGQFLLDENTGLITEVEKKVLLYSIATYLIDELGYRDHQDQGIYFYYGPTLKKEIYNASAIISAFLIKLGLKYNEDSFLSYGKRGIKYICNKQNDDGSWFYAGKPERPTIDCFHQSYILQSICSVKDDMDFDVSKVIEKGIIYYKTLFIKEGKYVRPIRYDKKFIPLNTWLFLKVDGRDIAEALIFFSKYSLDRDMVFELLNYTYDVFFNKNKGYMFPEIFLYGKNRIPYIEFQAWFLYALKIIKNQKQILL